MEIFTVMGIVLAGMLMIIGTGVTGLALFPPLYRAFCTLTAHARDQMKEVRQQQ